MTGKRRAVPVAGPPRPHAGRCAWCQADNTVQPGEQPQTCCFNPIGCRCIPVRLPMNQRQEGSDYG